MIGPWQFIILFCFCYFENLHDKSFFKKQDLLRCKIFEMVRQLKAREADEYWNVCSGSWILSHSTPQPSCPEASDSAGNRKAGDRAAMLASPLASVQQCGCGGLVCPFEQWDDIDRAYSQRDIWDTTFHISEKLIQSIYLCFLLWYIFCTYLSKNLKTNDLYLEEIFSEN